MPMKGGYLTERFTLHVRITVMSYSKLRKTRFDIWNKVGGKGQFNALSYVTSWKFLTGFQSEGDIFISSPVCKYAVKYPHWSCITKLLPEKHHLSSLIPHWLEVTVRKLPISYLLCQVNCDEFLPWNIKDYPWISLLQSVNDCEYWFWNIKKRP